MTSHPPCDCGSFVDTGWYRDPENRFRSEWLCHVCALKRDRRWKVQVCSVGGWADIKTSNGDGNYAVERMSFGEAEALRDDMSFNIEDEDEYRVVLISEPSEFDLY